jgi:hypothetical protein
VSHPPQGYGPQPPSRYKDEGGGSKVCCGPRVQGRDLEDAGCGESMEPPDGAISTERWW